MLFSPVNKKFILSLFCRLLFFTQCAAEEELAKSASLQTHRSTCQELALFSHISLPLFQQNSHSLEIEILTTDKNIKSSMSNGGIKYADFPDILTVLAVPMLMFSSITKLYFFPIIFFLLGFYDC